MISIAKIIVMFMCMVLTLAIHSILIITLRKKYKVSYKALLVGAIAFFVAVIILEGLINYYLLNKNIVIGNFIKDNPFIFILYAGFMAGIFEELARFVCFKFILKKENRVYDALAYGLGHAGLEILIVYAVTMIIQIVLAISINKGISIDASLISNLQQTSIFINILAALERVFALFIQLGLTLLVFKAVKEKSIFYLVCAILLHAGVDFIPAMYQTGLISNLFIVEGYILICALISFFYIRNTLKEKERI